MSEKTEKIKQQIASALKSSRGQNVLLYLLFVVVAFVFWIFLSLDAEAQRDFDVPVELQDVPDSVTIISQVPSTIGVSVKGKDSQLLRFLWGALAPIRFKWQDNIVGENALVVNHQKLDSKMRDYFGNGIQIVSCRPDSIRLSFTAQRGVNVKLRVQADIRPNLQYIISGPIMANVDSVTLYSVQDLPHSLKSVFTEPIVKSNLKDTMRYEVKVQPISGVRIIPDVVTVTIPVEPLIMRKRMVSIEAENLPEDVNLITFPSKVEISYLVPMSSYGDDYPVKAYIDFNSIKRYKKKLQVSLSSLPSVYHNVSFSPDSVEYIIENDK